MAYDDYALLECFRDGGILKATIRNPPVNLLDLALLDEIERLVAEIDTDRDVIVFVLKSGDPDFFIAHFDVSTLVDPAPPPQPPGRPGISPRVQQLCVRLRDMDTVSIAQIEGRVGGGGSEIAMAFDMRFGVIGRTIVNQMEVPLGIIPAGSGTQLMPRLIGRGRAIEMILGGIDLDAETAERWGYLNRALPADAIDAYVGALARRIAGFPREAVRLNKAAINGSALPLDEGLREERRALRRLVEVTPEHNPVARFLVAGGQTREGELRVADLCATLGDDP